MANAGKGVKAERMMQYVPKRSFIRRAKQKDRMIVLTGSLLQCVKISAKDKEKAKVNIHLADVKAVEELDEIAYAFQVVYEGKDRWNALYVVCVDASQRQDWVKLVTDASKDSGANFHKRYHSGVYEEANRRFKCCNKGRNTAGCREKTVRVKPVREEDTVDEIKPHRYAGGGSLLSLTYQSTEKSSSFKLELNPPRSVLSSIWSYFVG